jgi:alkaline phosphatase
MFRKRISSVVMLFLSFVMLASVVKAETPDDYKGRHAKYIFFFIGDGMALPQISSAEIYLGSVAHKDKSIVKLDFTQFPSRGIATTYDASSFITDSASAGTAMATGNKTLSGVIGMDVTRTIKFPTIAEIAKSKGMKIGIVSSVSLDHATPAAFYAHQPSRKNYYEIALELCHSGFDYFGGGGFLAPEGVHKDKENILKVAKENGYTLISSREDFMNLKPGGKVLAVNPVLQDESAMHYDIDREKSDISLADFTAKGIELLDNSNGFFMMVEGGKIDWACHANDAASSIKDVLALNKSVDVAMKFAQEHPDDTLIVVTGDHECGGMTIGFAGTKYQTFFEKLNHQKISYVKFDDMIKKLKADNPNLKMEDVMPLITEYFGLTTDKQQPDMLLTDYEYGLLQNAFNQTILDKNQRTKDDASYIAYGGYEPLTVTITHIINRKAGIGWTSYSHTGVPVPIYATGAGRNVFDGYYDNTDIYKKMKSVIGL